MNYSKVNVDEKLRQPPPIVENEREPVKVVKGIVKQPKRGVWKRFASHVFSAEAGDIKGFVIHDVIIPATKDLIANIVFGSVNQALYGTRGMPGRYGGYSSQRNYSTYHRGSGSSNYNANGYSNHSKQQTQPRTYGGVSRFEEQFLETKEDAFEVIERLQILLEEDGRVSLAEYLHSLGLRPEPTDHNTGWLALPKLTPLQRREGWICGLPRPVSII